MEKNRRYAIGINYFKAFLIVSVVLAHIAVRYMDFIPLHIINKLGNGGFSVSCFFVLSGFLSAASLARRKETYFPFDGIKYMWKHLNPLLLIYLLSCVAFVNDNIRMFGVNYYLNHVTGVIKNILLIHSWNLFKSPGFTINGVSWYLSCLVFLWMITPLSMSLLLKIKHKWIDRVLYAALIILIYFTYDKYRIFCYDSVPVRFLQYMSGMIIGKSIQNRQIKVINSIGVAGFWILGMCFFNFPIVALTSLTTVSAAMVSVFLYLKEENNQRVAEMINQIGEASGYIYLLHYPIIQLGMNRLYLEFPQTYWSNVIQMIVLFMMGIFIPFGFYKISKSKTI